MAFHTGKSVRHGRSDKRIIARLQRHQKLMDELIEKGVERDDASRQAMEQVLKEEAERK